MKHILMIVIVMLLLCTACAQQDSVTSGTLTQSTTTPIESAPTKMASPTPEMMQRQMSYTTGLPYDGDYRPILVVIENSPAARPQTGMQTADVVYEVPVEGSVTRFVCVFSDSVPEEVMPVRSARIPFLYIQHEWDAILMHYGGSGSGAGEKNTAYSFYGHKLYDDLKIDVDGLSGKWGDYYYRVSGVSAPHNVMGNPLLAQQLYDYDPEPQQWLFDESVTYNGENATFIELAMCSRDKDFITYTYNVEKHMYMRSMKGKPFTSAETGEQVGVRNVILQYSTYTVESTRKLWKLTGSGNADYYIDGKLIHGTWERLTENDKTTFMDSSGKQVVLKPGNTWIHICPDT